MKKILILLLAVSVLYGCKNEAIKLSIYKSSDLPQIIKNIVNTENLSCVVIYHNEKVWIIENNCSDSQEGIYTVINDKVMKYGWYDKTFNKWALTEGCKTNEDCFYNVTLNSNNKIEELSYHFFINLSEGFYKLKVNNGQLLIREKSISDQPS
ncbi:hypothetical protein [Aliikangiella maris]|uniref:Lipoprotein n=2 Tax=Aliikangiella maris TaxID=3162458 RepID=A0ABV2C085_9GAMM